MVGAGAGQAAVSTDVLPLSVDDPGALMWCVERLWVVGVPLCGVSSGGG